MGAFCSCKISRLSDYFAAGNEARAACVAAAGAVASGFKHGSARNAGANLDPDRGQVGEPARVVLQFNIFNYRRR